MLEFRFRHYNPEIARFVTVDPLASKYPYNSPYAFQENKLGLGRELEGLELFPIRQIWELFAAGQTYISNGVGKIGDLPIEEQIGKLILELFSRSMEMGAGGALDTVLGRLGVDNASDNNFKDPLEGFNRNVITIPESSQEIKQ